MLVLGFSALLARAQLDIRPVSIADLLKSHPGLKADLDKKLATEFGQNAKHSAGPITTTTTTTTITTTPKPQADTPAPAESNTRGANGGRRGGRRRGRKGRRGGRRRPEGAKDTERVGARGGTRRLQEKPEQTEAEAQTPRQKNGRQFPGSV